MAIFYGYNPPFIGGPQNVLSRQEDDQLIKNDLLQRLLTIPGERVNRPRFGSSLRSFLFEKGVATDIDALRRELSDVVVEDPRVQLISLDIEEQLDSNALSLKLVVRLRADPNRTLTIEQFIQSPTNNGV